MHIIGTCLLFKNYVVFFCIIAQFLGTNGPVDTTVCDGNTVNITCGITNLPIGFIPTWRIIQRYSNGSVSSDMEIAGVNVIYDDDDGLVWIPDNNNTENSRLLVGPVDETDNQSSYQCIFSGVARSTVGTLTVAGKIFYYVCICVFIV